MLYSYNLQKQTRNFFKTGGGGGGPGAPGSGPPFSFLFKKRGTKPIFLKRGGGGGPGSAFDYDVKKLGIQPYICLPLPSTNLVSYFTELRISAHQLYFISVRLVKAENLD